MNNIEVMSARSKDSPPPARYEGLDAFRVVGIYVVVMAHFHVEWAPQVSLGTLVYLRGCAFPFVILASFFVLSRSVLNKPGRGFGKFVAARFKRIELPFLIWTVIYWGLTGVVYPLRHGEAIAWPPATLLLSGYMHLWFLQFIFLGSIILYPLLIFFAGRGRSRGRCALACLGVSLAYAIWARPFVAHLIAFKLADADPSVAVFAEQANKYFVYVPAALALALCAGRIQTLYRRRAWRVLSLLLLAATMWLHLVNDSLPFTKGLYSLSVFVALLQPLPAAVVNALRPVAMYSYPVYILHYLVSRLVTYKIFYRVGVEATLANVWLGSVVVFGLSLLAAVLLRKIFPRDWLLPLIPISRRGPGTERGRRPHDLRVAPRRVDV